MATEAPLPEDEKATENDFDLDKFEPALDITDQIDEDSNQDG